MFKLKTFKEFVIVSRQVNKDTNLVKYKSTLMINSIQERVIRWFREGPVVVEVEVGVEGLTEMANL